MLRYIPMCFLLSLALSACAGTLARIDAVTLDEVSAACQRYFDPEDLFTLTLGPGEQHATPSTAFK